MYLVLRSEKVETPTRRRHRGPPRRRRKVSSEKRESVADSLSLVFVLEREVEWGNGCWTGSRPYIGQWTGSPMGKPMVSPWPVLEPNCHACCCLHPLFFACSTGFLAIYTPACLFLCYKIPINFLCVLDIFLNIFVVFFLC
jgi:hypothetical protein